MFIRFAPGAAMLLGLAACSADPAANNSASPANDAAAASAVNAAASRSVSASPDYYVGRWTRSGNCDSATELRADGTLWMHGEQIGEWRGGDDWLALGILELQAPVRRVDQDSFELTADGEPPVVIRRCPT